MWYLWPQWLMFELSFIFRTVAMATLSKKDNETYLGN